MIDQADRELQEWVKSIITGIDTVSGPPADAEGKHCVSLYLLALANPSPAWMNRRPPIQVALRYLVTTWATSEEEAHRLLGELLVALLGKREYELDLTELPVALWAGLGVAPRPAFTLSVPLHVERPQPFVKLVQGPLVVHLDAFDTK